MALENWLIAYTENFKWAEVRWLFDHILRNSNSVMPTAVLASVATGFPKEVGKAALPLLRTPELYFLDRHELYKKWAEVNQIGLGLAEMPFLNSMHKREVLLLYVPGEKSI